MILAVHAHLMDLLPALGVGKSLPWRWIVAAVEVFLKIGSSCLMHLSYWSVLCLDHIIQDCIYSAICYCLYIREKYSSRDLHLDLASTRIISPYLPWRSRGKQEII